MQLDLAERLACLLGMGPDEVAAFQAGGAGAVDVRDIAQRSALAQEVVASLLANPSGLAELRVDPNAATREQLLNIPGMSAHRLGAVTSGSPFLSLAELQAAADVPMAVLEELFELPTITVRDGVSGAQRTFTPVPFEYVVPSRTELESAGLIAELGFVTLPGLVGGRARAVAPSDLESADSGSLRAAFAGSIAPVVLDEHGDRRYFVPGSLDIWMDPATEEAPARRLIGQSGLDVTEARPRHGYYRARLAEVAGDRGVLQQCSAVARALEQHPQVLFCEFEEVGFDDFDALSEELADHPVPEFEEWTATSRHWNLDMIEAEAAAAAAPGASNCVVIVVDSGLRLDHPDLAGALMAGWDQLDLNFVSGEPAATTSPAESVVSHGTKVASVAVGRSLTSGARGVSPASALLPVKISGAAVGDSYAQRALAIREAVDSVGASARAVINISWATSGEHIGIREALVHATSQGIPVVTSAGNYEVGQTQMADRPHFPSGHAPSPATSAAEIASHARIPGVCSVAAVSPTMTKASYSYFGASSVTVAAPGGEPGGRGAGILVASTPVNYAYACGTSFAAPHVAGLLALLLSVNPDLDATAAVDVVRATATPLVDVDPVHGGMLGGGLVNARAALESAGAEVGGGSGSLPLPAAAGVVDVNVATAEQLAQVPLLGPWTASRIVMDRAARGPFPDLDDLVRRGLLDAWTLAQLRDVLVAGADLVPGGAGGGASAGAGTNGGASAGAGTNGGSSGRVRAGSGLVDVNAADAATIAALPLLGPWSARAIVADRERSGPFGAPSELVVRGVLDDWTLSQIADAVTV